MVTRSEEATVALPSGISLAYDTFGSASDPAILLIMGLSGPLSWWDPAFCEQLASRGFWVIRFDNRDVGHSSTLTGHPVRRSDVFRAAARRSTPVPYSMSDLADDALGLLDHLGIDRAHLTGVSMGGMIAQTIAIEHPDRVLSLVSMLSTTGRRSVGWQDPRLLPRLLAGRSRSREDYIAQSERTWAMIGSPAYPPDLEASRVRAGETYDRGLSVAGVFRQMLAVVTQPDRTDRLRGLTVPAMVIHGLSDRMVHVSGGRATAQAIPGAELLLIPGMGHDLPVKLWPAFIDGIVRTARLAGPSGPTTSVRTARAGSPPPRGGSR